MKYDVTFSCGHTGTVSLFGHNSDRERKIEWYESCGLCPECYKKKMDEQRAAERQEREEASAAAAENADAYGWPALEGTERQVAWALRLRQEFYEHCLSYDPDEKALSVVNSVIDKVASASDWIDGRDNWGRFLKAKAKEVADMPSSEEKTRALIETTVEPENRSHPGTVVITLRPGSVAASYQKDESFRLLVKGLGYRWDSYNRFWSRELRRMNGEPADRAAELGSALLRAGFSIRCESPYVREKAVSAEYVPEIKRWVMLLVSGPHKGDLSIDFPSGDDDAYSAARRISGSRWSSGSVHVPINEYASVLDMAETMHFGISDSARKAIDTYISSITIVVPSEAPDGTPDEDVSGVMDSSREVLPDLVDD